MRETGTNLADARLEAVVPPADAAESLSRGCLPAVFEAQVKRTPNRLAFTFATHRYTYAELDAAGNRMARLLIARGVGPEAVVGLQLPRSPELMIALLGIVKAGAAFLPMDPNYPQARLLSMLEDSSAAYLITTSELSAAVQVPQSVACLLMDDRQVCQQLETMSSDPVTDAVRLQPLRPDHLLYVIYTSGSTGMPKGVAVEHRSFVKMLQAVLARIKMSEGETLIARMTICFDPAAMELFLALLQGGSLEMLSDADSRDPIKVVEAAERLGRSLINAVPSFWRILLDCHIPRTVRAIVGGEALPADMVPELLELVEAINMYGPTEATVISSMHTVCPQDASAGPVVTIGHAIDGYEFYILDDQLHPLTAGNPGELYIAGVGLARGYLNRAKLTAERFVDCPFGPAGRRMYRSGDLAQWRADGKVEFLGRSDEQVKIRGYRVEPGEIESTILRLVPAIRECVVAARDIRGQTHLVAYHVNVPGSKVPGREELRAMLSGSLPDHMVPGIFMRLERVPFSPTGKLDRKALPLPEGNSSRAFQSPLGPTESTICKIFRDLTGASRVGRDDDFFQIGGHSLVAMLCIHRLRREFHREVTLRQLLGAPTAQGLARSLTEGGESDNVAGSVGSLTRPTIFLLPGMGGDEPRLVRFRMEWKGGAQLMPLDYPEWPQLLDPKQALDYVLCHFQRRIDEVSPAGPIWLLGYSLGGNFAHALAAHLQAAGRPVAFLGLLDAQGVPDTSGVLSAQLQNDVPLWHSLRHFVQDIARLLRAAFGKEFARTAALMTVRRLTTPLARPILHLAARHRDLRLPFAFGYHLHAYFNEARRVSLVNSWCRDIDQAPVPLFIPAFLFRSETQLPGTPTDLGWERHLPLVQILSTPGAHDTMLDPPHLKTLCERARSVVNQLLKKAEPAQPRVKFLNTAEAAAQEKSSMLDGRAQLEPCRLSL